jgi:hypothetical protein
LRDLVCDFGIGGGRCEGRVDGHVAGRSRTQGRGEEGVGRDGRASWSGDETDVRGTVAMSIEVAEGEEEIDGEKS